MLRISNLAFAVFINGNRGSLPSWAIAGLCKGKPIGWSAIVRPSKTGSTGMELMTSPMANASSGT